MLREQDHEGPRFDYEVLACSSFEELLEGRGSRLSIEELTAVALGRGRVLLQARGGAGKSVSFGRVAEAAHERGIRVISVNAVDWTTHLEVGVEEIDAALLWTLGEVAAPEVVRGTLDDQEPTILLVDGLNEVDRQYAQAILSTVDTLASRHPQLGIITADRLARRSVDDSWQLTTLTPVSDAQVREILGDSYRPETATLFSNPFFLEGARLDPTSAASHRAYFTAQLGVNEEALGRLASAVNAAYHEHKDRLMNHGWLVEKVGGDTVQQLEDAGALQRVGEVDCRFSHHLISDFLAAVDLASDPVRWTREEFDALTFRASSFDALTMMLDEAPTPTADLLVRRVHDWNLYASAYLVAEDGLEDHRVSYDTTVALLAMLAERLFDRLRATARQVADALRLQSDQLADRFLNADRIEVILELVDEVPGTQEWFEQWKALFLRREGEAAPDDVALLSIADGVLGWTAANVLKRLTLSDTAIAAAIELLHHEDPTVRWRSAHTLGASPSDQVVSALLASARADQDLWVRYGAIRSLIEIAATTDEGTRVAIFTALGEMAAEINGTPQLADETARALWIADPPLDWSENAGLLLEQLWASGSSVKQQDAWREVSASLRRSQPVPS